VVIACIAASLIENVFRTALRHTERRKRWSSIPRKSGINRVS